MLVHIKEIVAKAKEGNYGIGAFNVANLETTLGVTRAAVKVRAPIIIQVSEKTIEYAGLKPITHIVQTIAKNEAADIPVALHLDHGHSFKSVSECINAGFSSIHIDASDLPFDENVKITKESVDYAHKHGVWAQGELGRIFGKEGLVNGNFEKLEEFLTDPQQAVEFVEKTGVDTLAISVGTYHGRFKGKEKIYFDRLDEIRKAISVPLVLHGASGIPDNELTKAIEHGIQIVNIDTSLRVAFTEKLKETVNKETDYVDPRKILGPSIEAVSEVVIRKIKHLGSNNKA
ncbi:class II fructose-bisphosphate aldolase [Patescibacteria group bacterium]|nr:class II fructose-bisphosphate aldolase [Patescibacteria group bacterium]